MFLFRVRALNKMSIVYLSPNDFYVTQTNDLAHRIPKFSLVFFSSANCIYCKDVLPAFASVSSIIKGCTFAIMDVDQGGMRIVRMSEKTKTPITYVPFVVMYVNGTPIAIFEPDEENPAANFNLLKNFIIGHANAIRSGRKVNGVKAHKQDKICDTSIGMAICGPRKVCYLTDAEAYK